MTPADPSRASVHAPPARRNLNAYGNHRGLPIADTSLPPSGAMLRDKRKALGFSQRDLAGRCACTSNSIHAVETGVRSPSEALARRIAAALGIDEAEVFCAFRIVPKAAEAAFFDVDRMRAALAGGAQ